MKRIILLLAVVISSQLSAQEKAAEPAKEPARVLEQKRTISVGFRLSEPDLLAVTLEVKQSEKTFGLNTSNVYVIGIGMVSVTNGYEIVKGSGFVFEFGSKLFLKKESWKGFYFENAVAGGSVNFSASNYSGKYSYFSFFNPDLGFKWQVSKGFSIDPSVGCMWKIEFKGTGDVDNKIYTNFVPKIGLKIGYSF